MTPQPPSPRLVATDLALLALALVVATSPLGDVYAGRRWLLAVGLGTLLGAGVTLLSRQLRWGPLLTGAAAVLGYLLVGPVAAVPDDAVAGVLPSYDAVRSLVTGIVETWRTMLTLPVPLSADGELIVPFVLALLGALLATSLLWRSRWGGAAAPVVIVVFVVSAAFGVRNADLPLFRGLVLAVLLLLWLRWRSLRSLRTSWVRRVGLGVAVVSVASVAAWGLSAAVAGPAPRDVVRDHIEPPLAELRFKSPLARYRDYYKNRKNDVLFTFEDLPAGEPLVRLATMDTFDGVVWNVTTKDLVTGTSPFRLAPGADGASAITVTVGKYQGPWVPTVGTATGVELDRDAAPGAGRELLLNTATGSVAEYGDAREGDVFRVDWDPRPERSDDLVLASVDATVPVPVQDVPPIPKLDALAQKWIAAAGATTAFAKAVALEAGFKENGLFNDGLDPVAYGYSPSGHGAKRLADLVEDPARMVGNDEQYASAMAYAAQRNGLPARVVIGFESVRDGGTVTGDDIAAWVEIAFAGTGWIPFDPTPPENRTPPPLEKDPEPLPQPYIVQPPTLPQEPADVQGVPPQGAGSDDSTSFGDVLLTLLRWLWIGARILLLLAPLWVLLLYKRLRRRRRRAAADPVRGVSGGWREVTDRARELGVRVPYGGTRYEGGAMLAERFPESGAGELAALADQHVFGPGAPGEEAVTAYWAEVDATMGRMLASVPWWRRVVAWFSPASIPWASVPALVRPWVERGGAAVTRVGRGLASRLPRRAPADVRGQA